MADAIPAAIEYLFARPVISIFLSFNNIVIPYLLQIFNLLTIIEDK